MVQKYDLSVFPSPLATKAKELVQHCEKEILLWKNDFISRKDKSKCFSLLKESLQEVSCLSEMPSVKDAKNDLHEKVPETTEITRSQIPLPNSTFETVDVDGLSALTIHNQYPCCISLRNQ